MSNEQNPLDVCKHRWLNSKAIYFHKRHWLVPRRCRRCDRAEQLEYKVEEIDGKLVTNVKTTLIISNAL